MSDKNTRAAKCKDCGTALAPGQGTALPAGGGVLAKGGGLAPAGTGYLCPGCYITHLEKKQATTEVVHLHGQIYALAGNHFNVWVYWLKYKLEGITEHVDPRQGVEICQALLEQMPSWPADLEPVEIQRGMEGVAWEISQDYRAWEGRILGVPDFMRADKIWQRIKEKYNF